MARPLTIKDVLSQKILTPSARREVIDPLVQAKLSATRACQIAGLSSAAYHKRPMAASERDAEVIDALNALIVRKCSTHTCLHTSNVQAMAQRWLVDYDEYRPHEALGGLPPVQYMPRPLLRLFKPMSTVMTRFLAENMKENGITTSFAPRSITGAIAGLYKKD